MKRFSVVFCIFCSLAIYLFAQPAAAAQKVLVVSSSSKEWAEKNSSYQELNQGIQEAFSAAPAMQVEYMWANMDGADPGVLEAKGQSVIGQIRSADPDLILTIGDNTLRYIGQQIKDIPVVFTWIFSPIETFQGLPQKNITGVIQKFYTMDAWAMAHELLNAKTTSMISYENTFMQNIKAQLAANVKAIESGTGVSFNQLYLHKTFVGWEKTCSSFDKDFLYLGDTNQLDNAGKKMSSDELVKWTVTNSKKPVIGSLEYQVASGALFAIVTSSRMSGNNAGKAALKILIQRTTPGDISYITNKKGRLVINAATAQKLNIELPYGILSSAEKIYE